MNFKLAPILIFLFVFILAFLLPTSIGFAGTLNSSSMWQFNVTPDTVYVNWTYGYTGNFTLGANFTTLNVTIDNSTALHFNYTTNADSACTEYICAYMIPRNETGHYRATSKNLASGEAANLTLVNNPIQNIWDTPGRYRGSVIVKNSTNTSENLTLPVILDVPIYANNNTGIGSFIANFTANAADYHSFYFNTSNITNATGVFVNTSALNSSRDLDLFLFDNSGNLLEKSINKNGTTESLLYNYLPLSRMYEVRIYGNSSSQINYNGNIIFTTLNATHANNLNQQISSIDLGIKNASMTDQRNITLINGGALSFSNIIESKELYYVNRTLASGDKNVTFVVPDFVTKIKVILNWTGMSNYSFFIYNSSGVAVGSSMSKHLNTKIANANASLEEYNETTNIAPGTWRVEIKNNTNIANDVYNLTIYSYVNTTDWITTNYSTSGLAFNSSGSNGSNYIIQVNFTIPNRTLNGVYEGVLKYASGDGVGIKIPLKLNVTTSSLIANGTYNSTTITIDENINVNITRVVNVTIQNPGLYDIDSITVTNSTTLNYSSYNISITNIQAPSRLSNQSSANISLNFSINTTNTADAVGMYTGWIFLNTSSSTIKSHPYEGFNLTIRVNLTNQISVQINGTDSSETGIPESWFNKTYEARTILVSYLKLYYINGTQITGTTSLFNYSNITRVDLYQPNASYTVSNLTRAMTGFATNPFENPADSGNYRFNITVPANLPGGKYQVRANVSYNVGKLYGQSTDEALTISGEGFYMSPSTTSISINNASSSSITIIFYNYGPNTTSTTINFLKSGCPVTTTLACGVGSGTCTANTENITSISAIPAFTYNTNYNATWTITGSGSGSCTAYIVGASKWYNNVSLSITVANTTSPTTTTTSSSSSSSAATTTTPTYTYKIALTTSIPDTEIVQGENKTYSVSVKNTGNGTLGDVKTSLDLDSSWWSVSPSSVSSLSKDSTSSFDMTIKPPSTATVKNYTVALKASANISSATDSKSFVLKLMPSEAGKKAINESYANLTTFADQLTSLLNQLKFSGANVSTSEENLKKALEYLKSAKDYLEKGDYFSASVALANAKDLMNEVNKTAVETQAKVGWGIWPWIIVGVVVLAAVGLLIYMFLPPKQKRGFEAKPTVFTQTQISKPKSARFEKIKNIINKIKEKLKRKKKEPEDVFAKAQTWKI